MRKLFTFIVLTSAVVFSIKSLQDMFSSSKVLTRATNCLLVCNTSTKAFLRRSASTSQYRSLGPSVRVKWIRHGTDSQEPLGWSQYYLRMWGLREPVFGTWTVSLFSWHHQRWPRIRPTYVRVSRCSRRS